MAKIYSVPTFTYGQHQECAVVSTISVNVSTPFVPKFVPGMKFKYDGTTVLFAEFPPAYLNLTNLFKKGLLVLVPATAPAPVVAKAKAKAPAPAPAPVAVEPEVQEPKDGSLKFVKLDDLEEPLDANIGPEVPHVERKPDFDFSVANWEELFVDYYEETFSSLQWKSRGKQIVACYADNIEVLELILMIEDKESVKADILKRLGEKTRNLLTAPAAHKTLRAAKEDRIVAPIVKPKLSRADSE
jgi:hypothetical protein